MKTEPFYGYGRNRWWRRGPRYGRRWYDPTYVSTPIIVEQPAQQETPIIVQGPRMAGLMHVILGMLIVLIIIGMIMLIRK